MSRPVFMCMMLVLLATSPSSTFAQPNNNITRWNASEYFWSGTNHNGCYKDPAVSNALPIRVALLEHQWLGSAVDNWIAKFLIEEQLGVGVKFVSASDILTEMGYDYSPLDDASATFDLEYWEYTPDSWYNSAVGPNKTIRDIGPLGFAASVGWYIPTYLLKPSVFDNQLDYWRMYRRADVAEFFATNATNFSSGEWSGMTPDYGYEADMLANLKFNFTAIWYGSDNAVFEELYQRYAQQRPMFLYLWTPHYVFSRYNLSRVNLPPYSPECWLVETLADCDYPLILPRKLATASAFVDLPLLVNLLQNFALTINDQQTIMGRIQYDNLTLPEAVCEWLHNSEDRWRQWIVTSTVITTPGTSFSSSDSSNDLRVALLAGIVTPAGLLLIILVGVVSWVKRGRKRNELKIAPAGIAAIVFTDVQDSTKLWDSEPVLMYEALDLHNECLRHCMALCKGYEVKTIGDSFMIAFADPRAAAKFMIMAQMELLKVEWPAELLSKDADHLGTIPVPTEAFVPGKSFPPNGGAGNIPLWRGLRVRMGCNYGSVEREYSKMTGRVDYYGPTVNMAARIESVAHGGENVVSASCCDALRGDPMFEFIQIGQFNLKGIATPQDLYRLTDPFLSARQFPDDYQHHTGPTVLERDTSGAQYCNRCSRPMFCKYCSLSASSRIDGLGGGPLVGSRTSISQGLYRTPSTKSRFPQTNSAVGMAVASPAPSSSQQPRSLAVYEQQMNALSVKVTPRTPGS